MSVRVLGGPPRRALVRWSWRMFRREWRQQVLVLGLVLVAVAAAVAASSMAMSTAGVQRGFGTARAMSSFPGSDPARTAELIGAAETRFGPVEVIGDSPVPIPGSSEPLDLRTQDPDGRFGHTMLARLEGEYPTRAGEVALTPAVAALLDVGLGDEVILDRTTREVVGIVENPTDLGDHFALAPPEDGASAERVTLLFDRPGAAGTSAETSRDAPGADGAIPSVPVRIRGDDGPVGTLVLVAVSLAMSLVGLIAASGFVVVAQRRQRQLGLLAAIGATERHLRFVVVANGAIVGTIAGLVGTGLGIVGWVLSAPAVEQAAGRRIGRLDLPWGIVAGCAAIAVVMSMAAAWWPARHMSRVPVVAALAGRPPAPPRVERSLTLAAVALVAGVAAIATAVPAHGDPRPLVLIGGVIGVAIGTVLVAPAAIRVGGAPARRLPLWGRLALRDLARFQARAAAALAAITFVVGTTVAIIAIAGVNEYRADEGNLSDQSILVTIDGPQPTTPAGPTDEQTGALDDSADSIAAVVDAHAEIVPLDIVHRATPSDDPNLQEPISVARAIGDHSWNHVGFPYVATPELLAHLGIERGSIDPDTELLVADTRDVVLLDLAQRDPGPTVVQHADLPTYTSGPKALVTETAVAEHGWVTQRGGWLIDAPHALTTDQIAAARDAAADAGLSIEVRSTQDGLASLRVIATGAGAVLALAIVAMSVALIRSESARDLRTLTATGASRRIRRALTACTAGALALLGVCLGGTGAYLALAAGYHRQLSRLVPAPTPELVAIAVGFPLLATGAGWLLAGREPQAFARTTFD